MVKKVAKKSVRVLSSPKPRPHKLRELGVDEVNLNTSEGAEHSVAPRQISPELVDAKSHVALLRKNIFSKHVAYQKFGHEDKEKSEPDYLDYYHAARGLLSAVAETHEQILFGKQANISAIYSHLNFPALPVNFRAHFMPGLHKGLEAIALAMEGSTVRSLDVVGGAMRAAISSSDTKESNIHSDALQKALQKNSQEISSVLVAMGALGNSSGKLLDSRLEKLSRTIAAQAALEHATLREE